MLGRISAQVDALVPEQEAGIIGHFGFFDCIDDQEIANELLRQAEAWLSERGVFRVQGPFNLSINEECGLLVDGLDTPPCMMMGHALPYYPVLLQGVGYTPVQDMLAYHIHPDFEAPPVMRKLAERVSSRVHIRPLNRQRLVEELETLRSMFNDAWANNWGFVPFTEAEFADLGKNVAMLVGDDFIQIAELDGEPAAFIVAMPNINEILAKMNGSLLPFGWLRLLWGLKVRFPKSARVPLMGVRQDIQHTRLGPTMAFLVIDAVRKSMIKRGITWVELSWILEQNAGMRNIIESIGGNAYKRYRIFQRNL